MSIQKYLRIQLPKLPTQKCNINGVKLKPNFDPRKNISAFAYFTSKINSKIDKINNLLFIRKIARNWIDVALFRIGLKKTLTIKFRDGEIAYFKKPEDYFSFWNSESWWNELKQQKVIYYKVNGNNIELEYQNMGVVQ